ncbi:MAG TPA: DUF309 domain-containing protein [Leptolyngbyaceae cyanobacterium]
MTKESTEAFWQGVAQFNNGEYYACHDTLEALWMDSIEPEKTFYQGILQIAVALYHLGNQNWRGAVTLLGEGINRLRYYQPDYAEIDVDRLITDSWQLLNALQQFSATDLSEFVENLKLNQNQTLSLPKIVKLTDTFD